MPALHSFGRTTEAVWRATCPHCNTPYAANGERPYPLHCEECLYRNGIAWGLTWTLGDQYGEDRT